MLHIVLEEPGRLVAADRPEPVAEPGTALVRVHRIGICGTDLHAYAGRQPFFSYPRVLGHELGVEVIDPGDAPGGLRAGDRCAVEPYLNCGHCIACRRGRFNCCASLQVLGVHVDGGMRPWLRVPVNKLHRSTQLDYDQLALVETLGIGAHAVERGAPTPDDFILVIGAGPIGLSVVQFARLCGAKLAVMDISDTRLEFCRSLPGVAATLKPGAGALDELRRIGGGDLPTCVFDATGNPQSMAAAFTFLAPGGRLVFVGLYPGEIAFNDPDFHRRELTILASRNALPSTFQHVIRMVEEGRVDTRPWITHRFSLAEIPLVFGPKIAGNPAVLKAMVEVPD
ncbi:MAG: zinc-binding alcohol dehydrogenase family protein [Opitutae bacterium]